MSAPVIEAKGLTKRYGTASAVDSINFNVAAGDLEARTRGVVDDAHLLDSSVLAEIEALSTFGTRKEKLVQLVMTGDASIDDRLSDPALRAFGQQITVRQNLHPLDATETATYIDARLARAGVTPGLLFPPEAVTAVFERTLGVPRQINAVCSAALKAAFEQRQPSLTRGAVEEARISSPIADPEDQAAQAIG
jgi:type II secretory pathway predicted ATPase ExeA